MYKLQNLSDSDLECLDKLLSPLPANEFVRDQWGRNFIHVGGSKDTFASLFSWDLLNSVLEQNRFNPTRLRLYKAGVEIPAQRYLESPPIQGSGAGQRIKALEFTEELRHGATLILNCAEEFSASLRELAIKLERIFRKYVIVNLYAAFRTDNGFSLHSDNQDTLILQITGRKKWLVYEPKFRNVPNNEPDTRPRPTDVPIWDGILEEGSLFHIPRGWWHVAYPVDEPSLHVTITVKSHTGLDVLRWFVDGLKRSEIIRSNVPVWARPDTQQEYIDSIKQEVIRTSATDLVRRFIDDMDGRASPRPELHLPACAAVNGPKITDDTYLKLSSAGRIVPLGSNESGTIQYKYNGKMNCCSESLLPVLDLVNDGQKHAVREFSALATNSRHAVMIAEFVNQLALTGVVITEPREE